MNALNDNEETGCCKRFNPEPWEGKTITFRDKLFLKDHVTSFFHVPLNFGKVMTRSMEKIEQAGAKTVENVVLTDENSLWGADVYIAVDKEVPKSEMATLSGNFLSKVFEGPYKNVRNWVNEMQAYVKSEGKQMRKLYFYYTTCPKCAKAYGKNYVVLLAKM